MNITSIAAAVFAATMSLSTANATIYNYNGIDYDITTITGSFNRYESTLVNQVWWGDKNIAADFAGLVQDDLGFHPPNFHTGPAFAHSHWPTYAYDNTVGASGYYCPISGTQCVVTPQHTFRDYNKNIIFAIHTDVVKAPLPAGGLLLLSGLAGIVGLNRRKKHLA